MYIKGTINLSDWRNEYATLNKNSLASRGRSVLQPMRLPAHTHYQICVGDEFHRVCRNFPEACDKAREILEDNTINYATNNHELVFVTPNVPFEIAVAYSGHIEVRGRT